MQEGRNPHPLLVGMQISAATLESSLDAPEKPKSRSTMQSNDTTPGHTLKGCAPGYNRVTCTPMLVATAKLWRQMPYN
jgi:hypothetical protein